MMLGEVFRELFVRGTHTVSGVGVFLDGSLQGDLPCHWVHVEVFHCRCVTNKTVEHLVLQTHTHTGQMNSLFTVDGFWKQTIWN